MMNFRRSAHSITCVIALFVLLFSSCISKVPDQNAEAAVVEEVAKVEPKLDKSPSEIWRKAINNFLAEDSVAFPQKGSTLFIGSSSIRFWLSVKEDMAPMPVIHRGFGGCKLEDVSYYYDEIIKPYAPPLVVLFAGTNNFTPQKSDDVEEVFDTYKELVQRFHSDFPDSELMWIHITQTDSRKASWPVSDAMNALVEKYNSEREWLHVLDANKQLHDAKGNTLNQYFVEDLLHLNKEGYKVWNEIFRPQIIARWEKLVADV